LLQEKLLNLVKELDVVDKKEIARSSKMIQ
jgi:hypothetical protein